jgi:small subunit ribosomal protein S2
MEICHVAKRFNMGVKSVECRGHFMSEETSLLLPFETYEENAVNIGTQQKSADMARFIDTVRDDGLYLLDVNMTDSRIRTTAEFLNKFEAPRIMVVSARQYGQRPARKFAEAVGAHSAVGRFIPGSLTNPALRSYVEPDILFVTDPAADQQALKEAVNTGLPVVGIVDANNNLRNVDIAVPANNKGRRSLALVYWLLAREVLKVRGETTDEDWAAAQDVEEWQSTF